jgi:hypothetical protein
MGMDQAYAGWQLMHKELEHLGCIFTHYTVQLLQHNRVQCYAPSLEKKCLDNLKQTNDS